MSWKETNVNEERMKFIVAWKQGGWTKSDLCREFGISRVTGDKYIRQYEEYGIEGLKDKSHAPKKQAYTVRKKLVDLIVEFREDHPSWGARKLLPRLRGRYPGIKDWPCITTTNRILKRNGLVKKRKRIPKSVPVFPFSHVIDPNDVWCSDYKGHFTVGNNKRCDPLTISDAYSRFLLECRIVDKTDAYNAKKVFTAVFREYGLPNAIRTDNGVPFASTSIAGLSSLSVWWLKLVIRLERIEPGKPQQNGRHERMHRTLKQETALPPKSSLKAQQKAFDDFKKEFNFERPHEALKYKFPSQLYKHSKKEFPEKIPEVAYPTNMEVYEVGDMGAIGYGYKRIFISSSLRGELIGLEEISERHLRIHFCSVAIGVLDTYTGKLLKYKNPAPTELLDKI